MGKLRNRIIFIILLALDSRGASAAEQCPEKIIPNNLSAYSLVFTGEVADLTRARVGFKVDRVWKGDLSAEIHLDLLQTPSADDLYTLSSLTGGGEISAELARITFQRAEHYLVYAFGIQDAEGTTFIPSCRTKKLKDAKDDIAALGDGIAIADLSTVEEKSQDGPRIQDDRFVFPAEYRVSIEAEGPAGSTIVVFGALSTNAKQLIKLERVSFAHRLVYAGLRNGEQASFVTTDIASDYTTFEIQTTRVQSTPFTTLRDEGEFGTGKLQLKTKTGEDIFHADLSELPQGFKLKVTGSFNPAPKPPRGNEIVPFKHVNRLGPGISTFQDAVDLLGISDKKEAARTKTTLDYKRLGIKIYLAGDELHSESIIDSIEVRAPFDGKTPDGLCIGLSREAALKIIRASYHIDLEDDNYIYLTKAEEEESTFAIGFDDGKISEMAIW